MIRFNTDNVKVYLAPAGSGKTEMLMSEMLELLKTYRPDEIALVTFTRKGVENAIERALKSMKTLKADDLIHFKTLHALCFREAGIKHRNIIERSDIWRFNELTGFNLTLSDAFENTTDDDKLLQRYDAVRAGCRHGTIVERPHDEERYNRLVAAYEVFKSENELVDFYDCLIKFKEQRKKVQVKCALIDEAQDLTPLQWEVCEIAFAGCEVVRVSGDDYQSLFTYAGASPETLIELSNHYEAVKLERSYRLSREVYKFARGITSLIREKVDKDFKPMKDVEGFVKHNTDRILLCRIIREDLEKNGYTPNRWYLLFRTNCFIGDMTALLEQFAIPYHTAKGFCVSARDLAKVRRYLNFRKEGYSTASAKQAFMEVNKIDNIDADFTDSQLIPGENRYVVKDYIDRYGLDRLEEMAKGTPFLLASTTHRVKGGEADYAVVFLDCTQIVSENTLLCTDEEYRVLYVACTRPRIGLYTVPSQGKYGLDTLVDIVREVVE